MTSTRNRSLSRLRGTLMLAAEAFDHLAGRVHEFHRAISDIPFRTLKRVPVAKLGSEPTRVIHDGVTDQVYGVVRGAARALFSGADVALRRMESANLLPALAPPKPQAARVQDDLVAALSGAVGDHMLRRRNPLAIRFGVYHEGQRVELTTAGLRAAFPEAGPRVAVFLHGLCGNENVWEMFRKLEDPQTDPYGARLARDLGYTPVYVRYNSGLHISVNGRHCARALEALHANWPVQASEIVLVGHSMGGLVARSAADIGASRGDRWVSQLLQVVCLGSPHLGARLEKVVHIGTHFMKRIPLSRPIARLLDSRSLGIKDLRWGYTNHAEWKGRDPDAFWTRDRLQVAPVPGVRYRFLGGCLMGEPDHWVSRAIGDGLVCLPSSLALDVAGADSSTHVQIDHLRLLNHPAVYAQLHDWLSVPG